jgi:hypothetical protein
VNIKSFLFFPAKVSAVLYPISFPTSQGGDCGALDDKLHTTYTGGQIFKCT